MNIFLALDIFMEMLCLRSARTNRYLDKNVVQAIESYETDVFHYDHDQNLISCKLLSNNVYEKYFKQVYPDEIDEDQLNDEMREVIDSYTDSRSSECYMKTNINLLSANFDDIDWTYVNRLRSLIRALRQSAIQPFYYRGLTLSDTEIQYYLERINGFYYTNSFSSFTDDRLLVYSGNAILILQTMNSNDRAKKNLANISKWSRFKEEKETLLAVGSKLKVISVHFYGCKWEINVELVDDYSSN